MTMVPTKPLQVTPKAAGMLEGMVEHDNMLTMGDSDNG